MCANAQRIVFRGTTIRASVDGTDSERSEMNRDRLHGICRQFNGALKQHWGALTDNPRAVDAGQRERLAGRIQERRAISAQESRRQLEDFLNRNRNWWDLSRR